MTGRLRTALICGTAAIVLAVTVGCSSTSTTSATTTAEATSSVAASSEGAAAGGDPASPPPVHSTGTGSTETGSTDTAATDSGSTVDASGDVAAPGTDEPAATTPVPAPQGGDINQTVAAGTITTAPAVPLTGTADFGTGVTVEMVTFTRIDTTAQGPGEVAGPGVAVTLRFTNGTSAPLSLDNVLVDLSDGAQLPALPISTTPAAPVRGSIEPGSTADGVYVFTLPEGYTDPATVTVSYSAAAPTLVFRGNAS